MKKLIFNADDFGLSYGVNFGIQESHLRGVQTSTTIMAGMPAFDHAVQLAKGMPTLGIGVHLTLTCGRPLLAGHKTLTEADGSFHRLSFYKQEDTAPDPDEVFREWHAQIEKTITAGIQPTHLDSHHHMHIFKGLEPIFLQLAEEYHLPVRNSVQGRLTTRLGNAACPQALIDFVENSGVHFHTPLPEYAVGIDRCMRRLIPDALETLDTIEIMCHPAYLDTDVMLHSSFNLHRMCEVDLLTSPETQEFLHSLENASLANYSSLHKED